MTTTALDPKTAEQILTEAADLLDQDAWVQDVFHAMRDGKVCHCADGALLTAAGVETVVGVAEEDGNYGPGETFYRQGELITDHLVDRLPTTADYLAASTPYRIAVAAAGIAAMRIGGHPFESVIGYNDEPGRTREDVVRVLRGAIDFLPEAEARVAKLA